MTDPADRSGPRSSPAPLTHESGEYDLALVRARAAALARPLVKCSPSVAAHDECSDRAATAYRAAVNALPAHEWSVRKFADRIKRATRMHQDFVAGARDVPMACVLRLPEPARVAFIAEIGRGLTRRERIAIANQLIDGLSENDEDTARCA